MGRRRFLTAVIKHIAPPEGDEERPVAGFNCFFDSVFKARGIIAYFKIVNGVIRKGDKVKFFNTGKEDLMQIKVGVLLMEMVARRKYIQVMSDTLFSVSKLLKR